MIEFRSGKSGIRTTVHMPRIVGSRLSQSRAKVENGALRVGHQGLHFSSNHSSRHFVGGNHLDELGIHTWRYKLPAVQPAARSLRNRRAGGHGRMHQRAAAALRESKVFCRGWRIGSFCRRRRQWNIQQAQGMACPGSRVAAACPLLRQLESLRKQGRVPGSCGGRSLMVTGIALSGPKPGV